MNQPMPALLKVLTSCEVLTFSLGAMIGWSWVLLSGQWVADAGSLGAVLAFLVGGIVVLLIGLLYAELAAAMPKVGGEHVYTLRALGVMPSFVCTFALLVAYIGVCMFESAALLLATGAITAGSFANMAPLFSPGIGSFLMVLVIVPVMLVGFDVIPQSAEEIDLPPNRIGQVFVFSVFLAIAFYAVILIGVSLAPGEKREFMGTAASASYFWGSDQAGALIVLGGIAGILSSWNAFILGGSRVVLALSQSGMLPAAPSRLHPRFRTPYVTIMLIGVLSCASPWLVRSRSVVAGPSPGAA